MDRNRTTQTIKSEENNPTMEREKMSTVTEEDTNNEKLIRLMTGYDRHASPFQL
jgi:hypothetical protein